MIVCSTADSVHPFQVGVNPVGGDRWTGYLEEPMVPDRTGAGERAMRLRGKAFGQENPLVTGRKTGQLTEDAIAMLLVELGSLAG